MCHDIYSLYIHSALVATSVGVLMYYNYLIENSIFQDHLSCIQLYTLCRLIVSLGSFFLALFSSVQCNVCKLRNTCIFFLFRVKYCVLQ